MRQSKKYSASGISCTSASTPCTRRNRRIRSWKGSGRPAASSATTSPSRMNGAPESSRRAISTTSGRLAVTVKLDARAVVLVLEGRTATVGRQDHVEVGGDLGEHGQERNEQPRRGGGKRF